MHFRDIPGLEETKRLLTGAVRQGHVAHALLFAGSEGGGALPLALAFAAYLNCLAPTETDSCGSCSNCVKIHKHIHPDVQYVFPVTTTKSVTKEPVSQKFMAEWRAFLQEEPYGSLNAWLQHMGAENKQGNISREESRQLIRVLSLKAFEAPFKVIILWLPELLHATSANALLKILEEPPAQTVFLLVSNDSDRLLPTISSRLQRIQVRPFSEDELSAYLEQTQELPPTTPGR